nr:RNA-directed DNA polymerase, eukaryota [Tanacetum cinerariifolium]
RYILLLPHIKEDLSRSVLGKVKVLSSIANLYIILNKEGFADLQISYLGGSWVRIDLASDKSKNKLLLHKCVLSWFDVLKAATNDFVSSERIIWVDIEGIPLYLWSSLARKRICVKTSRADNILESFKEEDYNLVDDSVLGDHNNMADILHGHNGKGGGQESEDEGVSETIFGDNIKSSPCTNQNESQSAFVQQSDDPFGLNDLLDKPSISRVNELDPYLSHPTGFTPDPSQQVHRDSSPVQHNVNPVESLHEESSSPLSKAEVNCHANEAHSVDFSSEVSTHIHSRITVKGGSFLDDMIKMLSLNVQGLGNKTKKEWVKELNNKHGVNFLALQETKMDCISHLDVKFMWGNSNFQFVASDSVRNLGGILCVWEETIFKKENVSMSDNFISIYGTWLPTSTKILIVAIYAPQSHVLKRTLWEYILGLINRWNGETVVLGYFNEVPSEEERFGSIFNQSCARDFNCFISSSGLVDVKMEGFSFTWVHPSAKKMSKLDRFLVSNGIILGFPAITAICLDRHLSDHHHILLNEIHTDFGPTPFRTFHSWFSREGFDAMVEQAWSSFTHNDSNRNISSDEIRTAVWDYGENKSPGPDGYTIEFFRRYWNVIGLDFCLAVDCFFENETFPRGCNASFIALIPKVMDAKLVTDFRPISLIESVYKVVTKILANRLATVISDLVSNTQSAFVAKRQILDGPFILNEVLSWCKRKRKQALVFKVDFAKAYDSVRWDFLLDIIHAFGFGSRWCMWIRGIFSSNMALILVNGSPTAEFPMCCGLKQGIFRGLHIQGSVILSHLFYADDVVFIGEWSDSNLDNLLRILNCFYLDSGLRINVSKSQVLGIGVPSNIVQQGASRIGCDIMKTPFKYLGVMVGDNMSRLSAWSNSIQKIRSKLSKWKVKTLSIGGRLTLLKLVLGATPVYNMSIFKAPLSVLHEMEILRNNFFIGGDAQENNIDASVAVKQGAPLLDASFRHPVRDGVERSQWEDLVSLVGGISLFVSADRWVCDLTGDGEFRDKSAKRTDCVCFGGILLINPIAPSI